MPDFLTIKISGAILAFSVFEGTQNSFSSLLISVHTSSMVHLRWNCWSGEVSSARAQRNSEFYLYKWHCQSLVNKLHKVCSENEVYRTEKFPAMQGSFPQFLALALHHAMLRAAYVFVVVHRCR